MKSVSADVPVARVDWAHPGSNPDSASREQSRLSTWSPSPVHRGDDLPGVPLDCFTSSMIDDGSDPAYVPYEHWGCEPRSESPPHSYEELEEMEVDQD